MPLVSFQSIWSLRESITEALKRSGYVYKYDLSVQQELWIPLATAMEEQLHGHDFFFVTYGHFGDGRFVCDRSVVRKSFDFFLFPFLALEESDN